MREVKDSSATAPCRPLAERLLAAAHTRFVGRDAEIALFRRQLQAKQPDFAVLHLYGPGGVGKTTLLRELARIAGQCGRRVVALDARDIEISQTGLQRALAHAVGINANATPAASTAAGVPDGAVLLIDTCERIAALDPWLRETFLPQLPERCMVVLAGRNEPAPEWRTAIEWAGLVCQRRLDNLPPDAAQHYLQMRGVAAHKHAGVLAFTRGHPLALSLVADVLAQGAANFDPREAPDVIRTLVANFLRDVPSARHRLAIEVCAQLKTTTEAMLAAALDGDDAAELFDWLRGLSFIEEGRHGLFPHDLAREAFVADILWREPPGRQQRYARTYLHLVESIRKASGRERQRLQMEYLFLIRHRPGYRKLYDWDALDHTYAEAATADDVDFIISNTAKHEGPAAAHRAPLAGAAASVVPGVPRHQRRALRVHGAS